MGSRLVTGEGLRSGGRLKEEMCIEGEFMFGDPADKAEGHITKWRAVCHPPGKISIASLLMQMPAPSEVFLALEVRGLIGAGVKVSVYRLKGSHPERERLIAAQGLTDVSISCFPYVLSWRVWRDLRYWWAYAAAQ